MRAARLIAAMLLTVATPVMAQETLAITHVSVIDGRGGAPVADQTVIVQGSRIASLGSAARVAVPAGARIIDGRGKFVIPGLWDMHVHVSLTGSAALPLFLANGVTGVRDMGGNFPKVAAVRDSVRRGVAVGPRMVISGPILESANWLRAVRRMQVDGGNTTDDPIDQVRIGVANPADAAVALDSIVKLGADFVKVRTVASRATYFAIAAEARRRGITLAGHSPSGGVRPIEAADSGQRSIEHGFFPPLDSLTGAARDSLYRSLVAHATRVTPTIITGEWFRHTPMAEVQALMADTLGIRQPAMRYVSAVQRKNWQWQYDIQRQETPMDWEAFRRSSERSLREMHAAGVVFLVGTDVGAPFVFPGESVHDELRMLVTRLGLSPLQAIAAATRNPAEYFNADSLGTIETGKLADLVVLDANPVQDIANTRRISAVIVNGRILDRQALLAEAARRAR
jgi:imidazolonepropionase-like amidohydrolase